MGSGAALHTKAHPIWTHMVPYGAPHLGALRASYGLTYIESLEIFE